MSRSLVLALGLLVMVGGLLLLGYLLVGWVVTSATGVSANNPWLWVALVGAGLVANLVWMLRSLRVRSAR
jgi:hypothetical protein